MSGPELYSERPDWADVVPIEQYEGVNPLAPILYTPEYKDATSYFRAVTKSGEKSPRVLGLTLSIIQMNPAHYSAWQCRYETLLAQGSLLEDELLLMDSIAMKHMKTYQVWHHRRLLLTKLGPPVHEKELQLIARTLALDSKNYHTWSYRQWIVASYPVDYDHELQWVEKMITDDIRNNSAWHHRFFLVFLSSACPLPLEEKTRAEISYTKEIISIAPSNLSVWNYLRGILDHAKIPYKDLEVFVKPYAADTLPVPTEADVTNLEDPLPSMGADLPAVPALEFLADIYEEGDSRPQAIEIWKTLGSKHDTIRHRYWEYRIKNVLQTSRSS